jgi:hypothetical protein
MDTSPAPSSSDPEQKIWRLLPKKLDRKDPNFKIAPSHSLVSPDEYLRPLADVKALAREAVSIQHYFRESTRSLLKRLRWGENLRRRKGKELSTPPFAHYDFSYQPPGTDRDILLAIGSLVTDTYGVGRSKGIVNDGFFDNMIVHERLIDSGLPEIILDYLEQEAQYFANTLGRETCFLVLGSKQTFIDMLVGNRGFKSVDKIPTTSADGLAEVLRKVWIPKKRGPVPVRRPRA